MATSGQGKRWPAGSVAGACPGHAVCRMGRPLADVEPSPLRMHRWVDSTGEPRYTDYWLRIHSGTVSRKIAGSQAPAKL